MNDEGWIVTAAHIIQDLMTFPQHCKEKKAYDDACAAIEGNTGILPKQRRKQIEKLPKNYEWATNQACLWGHLGSPQLMNVAIDQLADLAVFRLQHFDAAMIPSYPVFRNPTAPMMPGTSLCRLGFPFHTINATFDEARNAFDLAPGALPVPRFPNDGMLTRFVGVSDGSRTATFIETSTPGLRGQSGGPVFDVNGHVWGIQSRTSHIPLGFAPTIKQGNREITEHQFMHVGIAARVDEIIRLLDHAGARYSISPAANA